MELAGGGEGGGLDDGRREISPRTVMPRRALAASGVAKLLPSACTTGATVTPASRVIVAVMRTLAASTMMATAPELTPAALAMELCRLEVLE